MGKNLDIFFTVLFACLTLYMGVNLIYYIFHPNADNSGFWIFWYLIFLIWNAFFMLKYASELLAGSKI